MTSHLLYEGPELERLLERVRAAHGPDVSIITANKVRRGGLGGFFAKELFQVTVRAEAAPEREPAATKMPTTVLFEPPTDEPLAEDEAEDEAEDAAEDAEPDEKFADMLDRLVAEHLLAETISANAAARTAPEPVADAAPAAWAPPMPPPPAPPAVPSGPAPAPTIATRRLPSPALPDDDAEPGSVIALRPRRVRRTASGLGGLDELLAQFENAWLDAGPLPAEGIIVVVGERDDARCAAASTADVLGIAAGDVVVATPHDAAALPSRAELAQVVAVLAAQGPVSVLVVELVPGIAGHEWARAVIAGVGPARVHLAVCAANGFDLVRHAVIAVGGVDAIDLVDVAASHSAEELLEMHIPIATLDGRVASPALWAATVLSRPGASIVHDVTDRRGGAAHVLGSNP